MYYFIVNPTSKTGLGEKYWQRVKKVLEEKKIEYIENPLPVPKKHIRKTMDYAFVPEASQMKYDIAVSDNDDFDLK